MKRWYYYATETLELQSSGGRETCTIERVEESVEDGKRVCRLTVLLVDDEGDAP